MNYIAALAYLRHDKRHDRLNFELNFCERSLTLANPRAALKF
ncbi:hypothetical protein CAMGR0001_0477 [Campylobacter gracilis RM3268]|uniref:Uncharacterized protein n=1 Tax=Campylobacter gracilis RM3268 TaxID=553220 RepID=C8PHN1_9BACT|nr:hypothetical protein CAMGR0001_0477 [Campylobacter gracilis RM3268]